MKKIYNPPTQGESTMKEVDQIAMLAKEMTSAYFHRNIEKSEQCFYELIDIATALQSRLESLEKDVRAKNAALFEYRKILDERPAMNAGLFEAYQAWTGKVYSLDYLNAIDTAMQANKGE